MLSGRNKIHQITRDLIHCSWHMALYFWEDWEKMKLNELGRLKLERQNSLFAADEAHKATVWLIPDLKCDSLILSWVKTVISASKPSQGLMPSNFCHHSFTESDKSLWNGYCGVALLNNETHITMSPTEQTVTFFNSQTQSNQSQSHNQPKVIDNTYTLQKHNQTRTSLTHTNANMKEQDDK